MGGFGSGRWALTPDTDDCLRISLSDLRRDGALKRHQMSRRRKSWFRSFPKGSAAFTVVTDLECLTPGLTMTIEGHVLGEEVRQKLELVAQPQPLGGERFYALCPITGRKCTVLYLPPGKVQFASAHGWRLPYTSTREGKLDRTLRAISKIECQQRDLSKYARLPTRARLQTKRQEQNATIDWLETRRNF